MDIRIHHDAAEQLAGLIELERQLSLSLSAVRASINEFAPILRLPDELLAEIFEQHILEIFELKGCTKNDLAWTRVCRLWRTIALSYPLLWRFIDISRPNTFGEQILLRSKAAPLSLVTSAPIWKFQTNFQTYANRIEMINIALHRNRLLGVLSSIGPDLPNVKDFRLVHHGSDQVSPIVLNARLPSLRRLSLNGVIPPLEQCYALTHLHLQHLFAEDSPSVRDLLTTFENCPQLEEISLDRIQPRDDYLSKKLISLPCLSRLKLFIKPLSAASTILAHLRMPSSVHLTLLGPEHDQDLSTVIPTAAHLRPLLTTVDKTLQVLNRYVLLNASTSPSWQYDEKGALLLISLTEWTSTSLLTSTISCLDLSHLTVLEAAFSFRSVSVDAIKRFFLAMPRLHTLRIAYNNISEVLSFLYIQPTPNDGEEKSPVTCPNLRVLSFGQPGSFWWRFASDTLQTLVAFAKNRAAEAPLDRVEFVLCRGINAESVASLKVYVKEIVMEGGDI